MGAVATKKVSVTLNADVLEHARENARLRGMSLSAWLSEAAFRANKVDEGLRAVREWEKENGRLMPLRVTVLGNPAENDDHAGL